MEGPYNGLNGWSVFDLRGIASSRYDQSASGIVSEVENKLVEYGCGDELTERYTDGMKNERH